VGDAPGGTTKVDPAAVAENFNRVGTPRTSCAPTLRDVNLGSLIKGAKVKQRDSQIKKNLKEHLKKERNEFPEGDTIWSPDWERTSETGGGTHKTGKAEKRYDPKGVPEGRGGRGPSIWE